MSMSDGSVGMPLVSVGHAGLLRNVLGFIGPYRPLEILADRVGYFCRRDWDH
jgi:hypothetical protein